MAFDDTANLLFTIGANSDDAEENIARFRSILSKDFEDMGGEIEDWTHRVFGALDSGKAITIAAAAGMAAAVAAVGATAVGAGEHYAKYVEEVEHGAMVTNLSTETMSGLRLAAQMTGTNFDTLTRGLAFFEVQVHKANQGGAEQLKLFGELGITQAQLAAGEKDIVPLLDLVAKRFHELGSGAERAAVSRGLFSRSGIEDQKMLDLLAQGIERFVLQARAMGIVVTEEDVVAMEKYRAAVATAKAQQDALDMTIGRQTLPVMENLKLAWVALIATITSGHLIHDLQVPTRFLADMVGNFAKAEAQVKALAESLEKMGAAEGGGAGTGGGIQEATEQWRGLSNMLETVKGEMAGTEGETAKLTQRMAHMTYELANAQAELEEKQKSGKLAPGVYERELAAMKAILDLMPQLRDALGGEIEEKNAEKVGQWVGDLNNRIRGQMEQTRAIQAASWNAEMTELRERLNNEKTLTVEQKQDLLSTLDALQQTHQAKVDRDTLAAEKKAGDELDKLIAEQAEKTYAERVAAVEREIEARRQALIKEENDTAENLAKLEALRKASLDKVDREQAAGYAEEISRLGGHLDSLLRRSMTHYEQLAAEYKKDLAAFSLAELQKDLLLTTSLEQRTELVTRWGAVQRGINAAYAADLLQLVNSQGWNGVFGGHFAELIRQDEALSKEWATSAQQSHMMVKVSLETLDEMGQKTFQQFAGAMGSAIAQSLVYSKSIGAAMEAALKSTLESLAGRALTEAIYATGYGFLMLAEQDYEGAAAAFEAAAIFGAVGLSAAMIGRAIPSGSAGGAGGSGSGAGGRAGAPGVGQYGSETAARQGDQQGVGAPQASQGPQVSVQVFGPVVGMEGGGILCDIINRAVLTQNKTLTATNTKTGVQVTQ